MLPDTSTSGVVIFGFPNLMMTLSYDKECIHGVMKYECKKNISEGIAHIWILPSPRWLLIPDPKQVFFKVHNVESLA
jgi:hypothetical protein